MSVFYFYVQVHWAQDLTLYKCFGFSVLRQRRERKRSERDRGGKRCSERDRGTRQTEKKDRKRGETYRGMREKKG